jgi:peptide/nickel transport system substrate-binding protein
MTGSAAAGAAFLAACGSGSSKETTPASSLVIAPSDTSKQAKRGGVAKMNLTSDPASWEPTQGPGLWFNIVFALAFQQIVKLKEGIAQAPGGDVLGDVVESYEFSPDKLSLTFKVRQGATFHNIPPVAGRPVDAQDIVYSWNRFMNLGGQRPNYLNEVNPEVPVLGVSASDARTVTMKLAFPSATLLPSLTNDQGSTWLALPKEGDGGYDLRTTLIGSGPFFLSEQVPSARVVFKRHPGYVGPFGKDLPFVDSIEYPIIPEYSAGLAQFKAGAIYNYPVRQDDVLSFKRDVPDLEMYKNRPNGGRSAMVFGYKPSDKTPFRDERVRQALSMSIERDLWIDTVANVVPFRDEGLTVDRLWNSASVVNEPEGWWLDPEGKDFGPNAKYYQHNIAEAKKLLAAAGYPNGLEVVSNSASSGYPTTYQPQIEILEGMAKDAGFSFKKQLYDYNREWIPQFRDSQGNFEGVAYRNLLGGATDTVELLAATFYSKAGTSFIGMDAEGKGTLGGDPKVDADIKKARGEFDIEKRKQIALDMQRYLGAKQYAVRYPGGATAFSLNWPALKNYLAYQDHVEIRLRFLHEWIDETQKPISKA